MKKYLILMLCCSIISLLVNINVQANNNIEYDFIDNHIIITINHEESLEFIDYKKEDFAIDEIQEIKDLTYCYEDIINTNESYDSSKFKRIIMLTMNYHDHERLLEDIETLSKSNSSFDAVEVDAYTYPSTIPDDTLYDDQSDFFDLINLPDAWNITTGSSSVLVGVMDSGIDSSCDFGSNLSTTLGISYVDGYPYYDDRGHGTKVASIIGMKGNNNSSLCGVCWNVTLVSIKTNKEGTDPDSCTSNEILGFSYAEDNNIKLINLSYNHYGVFTGYESALNDYSGLVVVSAGNDGFDIDSEIPEYIEIEGVTHYIDETIVGKKVNPQNYNVSNMIVVGNSTIDDVLYTAPENSATYPKGGSNFGRTKVNLFAPGVNIPVSSPTGVTTDTGTSFSAPLVTGVAALIMSINSNLTPAQIKSAILGNTDHVAALHGKCTSNGRLNAYAAIMSVHTHSYNQYTQYNQTFHKRNCCCGNYIFEEHTWTLYSPLSNEYLPMAIHPGSYFMCDYCGTIKMNNLG